MRFLNRRRRRREQELDRERVRHRKRCRVIGEILLARRLCTVALERSENVQQQRLILSAIDNLTEALGVLVPEEPAPPLVIVPEAFMKGSA